MGITIPSSALYFTFAFCNTFHSFFLVNNKMFSLETLVGQKFSMLTHRILDGYYMKINTINGTTGLGKFIMGNISFMFSLRMHGTTLMCRSLTGQKETFRVDFEIDDAGVKTLHVIFSSDVQHYKYTFVPGAEGLLEPPTVAVEEFAVGLFAIAF